MVKVALGVNLSCEKKPTWGRAGSRVSLQRNSRCKVTEVRMTLACLGSREKADGAEQTRVLTDVVGEA